MKRIIHERYPLDAWNIYAAQASDGDNFGADSGRCISLLNDILPVCQYFAYIEVSESGDGMGDRRMDKTDLWRSTPRSSRRTQILPCGGPAIPRISFQSSTTCSRAARRPRREQGEKSMAVALDKPVLLYDGPEWDFDKLKRVHDAIEVIARKELGLDVYPTQIEVITSEQMLDAYASVGLPLMYRHWSFGQALRL